MTKTHHSGSFTEEQMLMSSMTPNTPFVGFDRKTNFLTTSRTIKMFGAGVKAPERLKYFCVLFNISNYFCVLNKFSPFLFFLFSPQKNRDAKVVYLAGAWDMFHTGHISILEVFQNSYSRILTSLLL
jgi:hypothetical protein